MPETTPINWVKSICIVRNGNRILVSRDRDSVKDDFYFRPLGGSIEFRERSDNAVKREFMEELGVNLTNLRYLGILENIFTMEGENWHELDFIYQGDIVEKEIYDKPEFEFPEGDRTIMAMWIDVEEFTSDRLRLVPEELFNFI